MEAPTNSHALLSNAGTKERKGGWRGRLTLGPAELGDGVDEALVQVGSPSQSRLGVCRQHQARPAGARARCPIAGCGAVRAVVDQARREHLLLLLLLLSATTERGETGPSSPSSSPKAKDPIQENVPRLSLSTFLLVLASLQPLPLSTGSDSSLRPVLSLSLSLVNCEVLVAEAGRLALHYCRNDAC